MTAKDVILKRLRDAAGPVVPLPETRRMSAGVSDLVSLFMERATSVGCEIEIVTAEALAGGVLSDLTTAQVRSVAIWEDRLLTQVRAALRSTSFDVLDPWDQAKERVAAAGAGITTADFAIALTGTLVLGCSPAHPRSVSLLPPVHLAVVPVDRVVGTLSDMLARTGTLPSALTFITGPSRTADIELTPVRGAHGPTRVKVYLLK
ncbi:MAG: lactate utilization protein [Armatimonadetes bacterium]|nr:lactate utilization protein [Armatimonadota bacterium]